VLDFLIGFGWELNEEDDVADLKLLLSKLSIGIDILRTSGLDTVADPFKRDWELDNEPDLYSAEDGEPIIWDST